jgi:hypothetical protein
MGDPVSHRSPRAPGAHPETRVSCCERLLGFVGHAGQAPRTGAAGGGGCHLSRARSFRGRATKEAITIPPVMGSGCPPPRAGPSRPGFSGARTVGLYAAARSLRAGRWVQKEAGGAPRTGGAYHGKAGEKGATWTRRDNPGEAGRTGRSGRQE